MEKNKKISNSISIEKTYVGRDINSTIIQTIGKLKLLKLFDASPGQHDYAIKLWNAPQHNPNFIGRKSLLDEIKQRMQQSALGKFKPIVITACHGLGGVGKTQLTIEFIHQNLKDYQMICWIPADSSEQIETAYLELAQDLGLVTADKRLPLNEVILMVKVWFIAHPTCLLVYDNAPNYQVVESFLPQTGSQILITSRHTEWPEAGIQVDVFTVDEAREFIKKILGKQINDQEEQVDKLAEILARLPLALAQATAYIKKNGLAIARYIELYEKRKAEMLSRAVLPPGDHHAVVYVTWDITMEQIQKESPLAPKLLTLCAYLHHDGIPRKLLSKFSQQEKNIKKNLTDETIGILLTYSMLNADIQNDSVSIHALVQEVVRLKLKKDENLGNLFNFYLIIRSTFPYAEETKKDYLLKRILAPHLEAFIKIVDKTYKAQNDEIRRKKLAEEVVFKLYTITSDAHRSTQNLKRECQLVEKALELDIELHGENNYEVADTLADLGGIYIEIGKYNKAQVVLEQALKIKENYYSDDDPDMLYTLFYLGKAYSRNDLKSKSIQIFERALNIKEKFSEDEGISAANLLHEMAIVYSTLGYHEKEFEYLEKAMKIDEGRSSVNPLTVAARLNDFALASSNIHEDSNKCLKYLKESLDIKKKYYESDNPDIAYTYEALSQTYISLGKYNEAIKQLEKALEIRKSFFGYNSQQVASTLGKIARIHSFHKNEKENANNYYKDALDCCEKNYIENDVELSEIFELLNNNGSFIWSLNFTDVENLIKIIVKITKNKSKDYPDTAFKIFIYLSDVYLYNEDEIKTLKLLKRSIEILSILNDQNLLYLGLALMKISNICDKVEDLNLDLSLKNKAFEIYKFYFDRDPSKIELTLHSDNLSNLLGVINLKHKLKLEYKQEFYCLFNYAKTISEIYIKNEHFIQDIFRYVNEALELIQPDFQYNHYTDDFCQIIIEFYALKLQLTAKIHTLTAVENSILNSPRNYEFQVRDELNYKIKEREILLEPNNPKICEKIARLALEKGYLEKSIFYYEKLLNLITTEPSSYQFIYHNLGCLYHVKGNFEFAEQYFKKSLAISTNSPNCCDYGFYLMKQERYKEASDKFSLVIKLNDENKVNYGKLESRLFDKYLQQVVFEEEEISIKSKFMAYYWKVQCLNTNKNDRDKIMIEFESLVEKESTYLNNRLLSCTFENIGNSDKSQYYFKKAAILASIANSCADREKYIETLIKSIDINNTYIRTFDIIQKDQIQFPFSVSDLAEISRTIDFLQQRLLCNNVEKYSTQKSETILQSWISPSNEKIHQNNSQAFFNTNSLNNNKNKPNNNNTDSLFDEGQVQQAIHESIVDEYQKTIKEFYDAQKKPVVDYENNLYNLNEDESLESSSSSNSSENEEDRQLLTKKILN